MSLAGGRSGVSAHPPLRHNDRVVRMRKVPVTVAAIAIAVGVLVLGAVGVDYGTSM